MRLNFAVVTVSSSKAIDDDMSGKAIKELIGSDAHSVLFHVVVHDDRRMILSIVKKFCRDPNIDVVITNGGTGISGSDVTIEAVRPLFEKELAGFNPLFMQLSFSSIGPAAYLSRATAGIVGKKAVFCLPGSPRACRLAMENLIMPEAGHIITHLGER
ncbi:molybdenum cofactor biosynthesis protein MoaB [Candidatus Woesearchaeota archaeon]|nr:molybdenum cofactor biosynthesis protein MoaB [Candidatus Woesearchaeota archaeon]